MFEPLTSFGDCRRRTRRRTLLGRRPEPRVAAVPIGFLIASVPFTNVAARLLRGVDLRQVGNGTVSGSALFEVAGMMPLVVTGVLEVAKGAVGPAIAGGDHPLVAAAAAGAAVSGHNWSPFLAGAGGRGLSPAMGALAVSAPSGSALLLGGMAAGRLMRQTALGALLADVALVPIVRRVHGRGAAWSAIAVVIPMVVKRLTGNERPRERSLRVYAHRLMFDRDPPVSVTP